MSETNESITFEEVELTLDQFDFESTNFTPDTRKDKVCSRARKWEISEAMKRWRKRSRVRYGYCAWPKNWTGPLNRLSRRHSKTLLFCTDDQSRRDRQPLETVQILCSHRSILAQPFTLRRPEMLYLGIDQHKAKITVNLRNEQGNVVLQRKITREPFKTPIG